MKAAHEGVPVAGLPLGAWRSAEAPDASPTPPLNLTGAQAPTALPGGRGGGAQMGAASQTVAPPPAPVPGPRGPFGPAADWAPIPPASIPNAGPASRDKGPLNKLLRTL